MVGVHGSPTAWRGVYVVAGCCICRDCEDGPARYELAPLRSADRTIVGPCRRLECVGRSSITPTGARAELRRRMIGSEHCGWSIYEGDLHLGWVVRDRDGTWSGYAARPGQILGRQVAWGCYPRSRAVNEVLINREVWKWHLASTRAASARRRSPGCAS